MYSFKQPHKQISLFITAGYPKLDSLSEQLALLDSHNIDFVEVGIPFSDPLADGPTIQHTSTIALQNGMTLSLLFDQLKDRSSKLPIVLMGYLNPVLRFGMENFIEQCVLAEVRSIILPDLPFEVYQREYQTLFESTGLAPVFLITPRTSDERIVLLADACKNSFLYLVSSNATTGGSQRNLDHARISEIKQLCGETPLFIGFGIRDARGVREVHALADGAIIGSAFLQAIENQLSETFLTALTSSLLPQ